MLFNSAAYLVFLPIVVCLFWLTPWRGRTALLLVASYYFYMTWKPEYGLLIFGLTALNYAMGLLIAKFQAKRKLLLVTAIAANLLLLCYFKYTYFLRDTVNSAIAPLGHSIPAVPFEIILPLGISFFVFEFIHYVTDVYRGSQPIKSFPKFALFASFFPTQIAGPIKRFQDFIPQLEQPQKICRKDFDEAFELILFGLLKKVVFADNLASVVQAGFANPASLSSADLWLTVYAFAFQVYFDFSGYTDIARGSAQLMGFKVPINFNIPYMSDSITEYWRRWHMSLGTWLRDYLFFPLGGSKGSQLSIYKNTMITMVLCGLWHGPALRFVGFGAYHGLLLVIHRAWRLFVSKHPTLEKIVRTKVFHLFAIFLTFHSMCMSLVIFRSEKTQTMITVFKKLFLLEPLANGVQHWQLTLPSIEGPAIYLYSPLIIAVLFAATFVGGKFKDSFGIMPIQNKYWKAAYLALIICALMVFSPESAPRFIYFQF